MKRGKRPTTKRKYRNLIVYEATAGPLDGTFVGDDYPYAKRKAFDSRKEYRRWLTLVQAEKAGLIHGLRRQVGFKLRAIGGKMICRYYADFVYIERGERVVEDVKARRTDVYRLKKLWMLAQYGITIREV